MSDQTRDLCLMEELEIARDLILCGFEKLQQINIGNAFYHLPQLLIANGFERLLKCYFCLVDKARKGQYPTTETLKNFGHDLEQLKQKLISDYFNINNIPLLSDDLEFLKCDHRLEQIIHILSEFGQKTRYYNLNIVTGSKKTPIDPNGLWEDLERDIEDPSPYLSKDSIQSLSRDYYPRVNAKIIAKLEHMVRSIALQFTLGKHGGNLKQMSPILSAFYNLRNEEFGTKKYYYSIEQSTDRWVKRCKAEVLSSSWPSRVISKEEFSGEWPFHCNEVIIECREGLFCIVNIEDYDFALNGAAKSRFNYPDPHDADVAIFGKSIGPFIDMARELSLE
ncbi:YebY family protein [bacterium]|nr:YebY family protein [bacterium]